MVCIPSRTRYGWTYMRLKKRLGGGPIRRRKAVQPAFVELIAPHPAALEECSIEFESSSGGKMRIQWKAVAPPDWASLLRAWRESEGMIQITAQMRVLVAIKPVDGRKGIDSLSRLCQDQLAEDPFSGCVFVFRSRSGTAIRLLTYDGQGYWLAQKAAVKGAVRVVAGSDRTDQTAGSL